MTELAKRIAVHLQPNESALSRIAAFTARIGSPVFRCFVWLIDFGHLQHPFEIACVVKKRPGLGADIRVSQIPANNRESFLSVAERETYGFTSRTSPNFFFASGDETVGGTMTSSPGLEALSVYCQLGYLCTGREC